MRQTHKAASIKRQAECIESRLRSAMASSTQELAVQASVVCRVRTVWQADCRYCSRPHRAASGQRDKVLGQRQLAEPMCSVSRTEDSERRVERVAI